MSRPPTPPHTITHAPGKEPETDQTPVMTERVPMDVVGDDNDLYFWEGSFPWDPTNWGWLGRNVHCLIRMFEVPAPATGGPVTQGVGSSRHHTLPEMRYPLEQIIAALVAARSCDLSRIRGLERQVHELKTKMESMGQRQQDIVDGMTAYVETHEHPAYLEVQAVRGQVEEMALDMGIRDQAIAALEQGQGDSEHRLDLHLGWIEEMEARIHDLEFPFEEQVAVPAQPDEGDPAEGEPMAEVIDP
jgi:hypothetical protein